MHTPRCGPMIDKNVYCVFILILTGNSVIRTKIVRSCKIRWVYKKFWNKGKNKVDSTSTDLPMASMTSSTCNGGLYKSDALLERYKWSDICVKQTCLCRVVAKRRELRNIPLCCHDFIPKINRVHLDVLQYNLWSEDFEPTTAIFKGFKPYWYKIQYLNAWNSIIKSMKQKRKI